LCVFVRVYTCVCVCVCLWPFGYQKTDSFHTHTFIQKKTQIENQHNTLFERHTHSHTHTQGMPWMVAADVRSLTHVRALAKYKEKSFSVVSGHLRPLDITRVVENRLTGVCIHLLIFMSIFFLEVVEQVCVCVCVCV